MARAKANRLKLYRPDGHGGKFRDSVAASGTSIDTKEITAAWRTSPTTSPQRLHAKCSFGGSLRTSLSGRINRTNSIPKIWLQKTNLTVVISVMAGKDGPLFWASAVLPVKFGIAFIWRFSKPCSLSMFMREIRMAKGKVSKIYDDTVEAIKGMVGAKKKKRAKKAAKKGRKPTKTKAKSKKKKK
jgi:hypothetical protein